MKGFKALLLATSAAAASVLLAAPALAQPAIFPIAPHQYFGGEVNGNLGHSLLSVVGCSPATSSATASGTGTIMPGQSVEVTHFLVPPPGPGGQIVGYTAAAHRISVDLDISQAKPPLVRIVHVGNLADYQTKVSLPFDLSVPCSATVTAVFAPINGGAHAVESVVSLTLASPHIVPTAATTAPGPAVSLAGSGFVPNTNFTVEECSKTSWIAPQNPCGASNQIQATTNASGAFTHGFTVQACSPALASTCYVGTPVGLGVDVVTLAGAAPVHTS